MTQNTDIDTRAARGMVVRIHLVAGVPPLHFTNKVKQWSVNPATNEISIIWNNPSSIEPVYPQSYKTSNNAIWWTLNPTALVDGANMTRVVCLV